MGGRLNPEWKLILQGCVLRGKEAVLRDFETFHHADEEREAWLWGDPATYPQARRLAARVAKQAAALATLRHLPMETIVAILRERNALPSPHEKIPKPPAPPKARRR